MGEMPAQDYRRNARAKQYIRWLKVIGKPTAAQYPRANGYELQAIEQAATQLIVMVGNAAQLPPEVER